MATSTYLNQQNAWKALGLLSGLAAGVATRWVVTRAWELIEGEEPPGNPASPNTNWSSALVWAVASGASLAVGRLVAQRGAAEAWKTATGSYPEGIEELRP